jgi:hypothetical protein
MHHPMRDCSLDSHKNDRTCSESYELVVCHVENAARWIRVIESVWHLKIRWKLHLPSMEHLQGSVNVISRSTRPMCSWCDFERFANDKTRDSGEFNMSSEPHTRRHRARRVSEKAWNHADLNSRNVAGKRNFYSLIGDRGGSSHQYRQPPIQNVERPHRARTRFVHTGSESTMYYSNSVVAHKCVSTSPIFEYI